MTLEIWKPVEPLGECYTAHDDVFIGVWTSLGLGCLKVCPVWQLTFYTGLTEYVPENALAQLLFLIPLQHSNKSISGDTCCSQEDVLESRTFTPKDQCDTTGLSLGFSRKVIGMYIILRLPTHNSHLPTLAPAHLHYTNHPYPYFITNEKEVQWNELYVPLSWELLPGRGSSGGHVSPKLQTDIDNRKTSLWRPPHQ